MEQIKKRCGLEVPRKTLAAEGLNSLRRQNLDEPTRCKQKPATREKAPAQVQNKPATAARLQAAQGRLQPALIRTTLQEDTRPSQPGPRRSQRENRPCRRRAQGSPTKAKDRVRHTQISKYFKYVSRNLLKSAFARMPGTHEKPTRTNAARQHGCLQTNNRARQVTHLLWDTHRAWIPQKVRRPGPVASNNQDAAAKLRKECRKQPQISKNLIDPSTQGTKESHGGAGQHQAQSLRTTRNASCPKATRRPWPIGPEMKQKPQGPKQLVILGLGHALRREWLKPRLYAAKMATG